MINIFVKIFLPHLKKLISNAFTYFFQFRRFRKEAKSDNRFSVKYTDAYPCLTDNLPEHTFDRHYIYHTGWAARKLKELAPEEHIDISSSLYFCSIASAFLNIKYYDYRMPELYLNNMDKGNADLTALPFADNSIKSLSCMHVIEHIGLGRYGDPINPSGDLVAFAELSRVLAPGGNFLFVVPIGKPKIMYNAHRIYSKKMILDNFSSLKLLEFSMVPDLARDGGIIIEPPDDMVDKQSFACGLFVFTKE